MVFREVEEMSKVWVSPKELVRMGPFRVLGGDWSYNQTYGRAVHHWKVELESGYVCHVELGATKERDTLLRLLKAQPDKPYGPVSLERVEAGKYWGYAFIAIDKSTG